VLFAVTLMTEVSWKWLCRCQAAPSGGFSPDAGYQIR